MLRKRVPQKLSIKDHKQDKQIFVNRVFAAIIFMMVLTAIICGRLIYLQTFKHSLYSTLSNQNLMYVMPIEPTRGLIYDRNGVLLAKNIPVFNLEIIPARTGNLEKTLQQLKRLVSLSDDEITAFYTHKKEYRPFQPIPLKQNLNEQEIARFYVDQYRLPGVIIQTKMLRRYPMAEVTGNITGYVARIDAKELEKIDRVNYSASDYIGKTGIEKYYENELHGTVGAEEAEINANNRITRILKKIPPIPGKTLYLTIDSALQAFAEKALGNNGGAVVAIQPDTGQILALVTSPRFDPNAFVIGINRSEYQKLLSAPLNPLYDRSIHGLYAPGSTIKPFYSIGGLNAGVIDKTTRIYDPGWFRLPNTVHIYHDAEAYGYGWVNVTKAITVSSDTFFYTLAVNLGIRRVDDILSEFGFGAKTGVDLPHELPGIVPTPEWKLLHHHHAWYPGDTVITGIGQGSLVTTPLQLATAVATLAEHGKRVQPHLLLRSLQADGAVYTPDSSISQIQLNNNLLWDIVIQAMQQVILSPIGTAHAFGHQTLYTVAGKTGTAQVYGGGSNLNDDANRPYKLKNNHLFISFAPVDRPQIAMVVVVEHAALADKISREILDFYFQHPLKK